MISSHLAKGAEDVRWRWSSEAKLLFHLSVKADYYLSGNIFSHLFQQRISSNFQKHHEAEVGVQSWPAFNKARC